jgi:hypothetical protein
LRLYTFVASRPCILLARLSMMPWFRARPRRELLIAHARMSSRVFIIRFAVLSWLNKTTPALVIWLEDSLCGVACEVFPDTRTFKVGLVGHICIVGCLAW